MVRNKEKKDKIIFAHPTVSMLSDIEIVGKKHNLIIGGFCCDGFFLESPYELVKKESTNFSGKDIIYYHFVKGSKKMSEKERGIRKSINKRTLEEKKYKKDRKRQLQKELDDLNKQDVKKGQCEVKE